MKKSTISTSFSEFNNLMTIKTPEQLDCFVNDYCEKELDNNMDDGPDPLITQHIIDFACSLEVFANGNVKSIGFKN